MNVNEQADTNQAQTGLDQIQSTNNTAVTVEMITSNYTTSATTPVEHVSDISTTADVLLSGINFNETGGPLLFNHPGSIAAADQHLILADRNNNRVLIWNILPTSNVPPDIVLGQTNFMTNNPGQGRNQLDWPIAVATDGTHVIVADTYNDRILIWNTFPTTNGSAADIILQSSSDQPKQRGALRWPWGVWTDGTRLAVTSTSTGQVLIWNHFPTADNTPPDIIIANADLGTPRGIHSNGQNLIVDDHNAFATQQGTFFWNTFPTTDDQPYDFFMVSPQALTQPQQLQPQSEPITPPADNQTQPKQAAPPQGEQLYGIAFGETGAMYGLTNSALYRWTTIPDTATSVPDLTIAGGTYNWMSGDGSSLVLADDHLYVAEANGNKILGYTTAPTTTQAPDFVIGSPDIATNTLDAHYFITNPVPATDGTSLLVTSDFNRKLYIWKQLPDDSGAAPDLIYNDVTAWDNELHDHTFVAAGGGRVYLWDNLPTDGGQPTILDSKIGSVQLRDIKGVAFDDRYFYLADKTANTIYVWSGIPSSDSEPVMKLNVSQPERLSSDGTYLAVATGDHASFIQVLIIANLTDQGHGQAITIPHFNLPMHALVSAGHLFVADTIFNRVVAWDSIAAALAGQAPDQYFGATTENSRPQIGQNTLFWPGALAFDGAHLWVGEFKFSGRLVRYSAR